MHARRQPACIPGGGPLLPRRCASRWEDVDALSIALSGMHAGALRVAASAHDVANVETPDAQALRTELRSVSGGGVRAEVRAELPGTRVDLARELVEQMLASTQYRASLRVADTALELRGHLVDLLA